MCTAAGLGALLLLRQPGLALPASLLFGLFGGAPAGVIVALTGQAMAPQRRAFGMGVFYSFYFVLLALAPLLMGEHMNWLAMLAGFVVTLKAYWLAWMRTRSVAH